MSIITLVINFAQKNVIAVHGVGESGKPELVKPRVIREKLLELISSLPGMEACSGAARIYLGHRL